jgi:hypothetical protein
MFLGTDHGTVREGTKIFFRESFLASIDSLSSKLFDHRINPARWRSQNMLQSESVTQLSRIPQTPGVIQSLEHVRERVKEQLMNVPEFRAFLAMETSIAEVSHIPDLAVCLESAKEKIMERLMTVREYRAMLAVEKSIAEISDVLGVLGDEGEGEGPSATSAAASETPAAPQAEVNAPNPVEAAAARLARVLGLVSEPIDNRIS